MPTLTATIDRAKQAVRLYVDDRTKVQGLIRTDANGTRPVRFPANLSQQLPGIGDGTFMDYEVALGGRVSYRLVHPDFRDLVWVDMSGDWDPSFILPAQPDIRSTVGIVTDYDAERETVATFHRVIDRPDPLVVEGVLSSRSGSMRVEFDSLKDSAGLEALLRRGRTVMYRQSEHPGMDMYFNISKFGTNFDPEMGLWSITIGYTEVSRPAGDMTVNDSWTFATVTAAHTDFTQLSLAYDSFTDLKLGDANNG